MGCDIVVLYLTVVVVTQIYRCVQFIEVYAHKMSAILYVDLEKLSNLSFQFISVTKSKTDFP